MSSIVLRGATEGMLDDVERAVDDGVNAYKVGSQLCLVHSNTLCSKAQHQQCVH